jgi:hypothetical protein
MVSGTSAARRSPGAWPRSPLWRKASKTPEETARLDILDHVDIPQGAVKDGVYAAPVLDGQGLGQTVKGANQGVRYCG